MIKKLDKRTKATEIDVDPNEGERSLLSSNKGGKRSHSLDFNPNSPFISEEILIDYLASILVEGFLNMKNYERTEKKSSNIL